MICDGFDILYRAQQASRAMIDLIDFQKFSRVYKFVLILM